MFFISAKSENIFFFFTPTQVTLSHFVSLPGSTSGIYIEELVNAIHAPYVPYLLQYGRLEEEYLLQELDTIQMVSLKLHWTCYEGFFVINSVNSLCKLWFIPKNNPNFMFSPGLSLLLFLSHIRNMKQSLQILIKLILGPRKFKGGICCGVHLAITCGNELLYLRIFS